MGGVDIFWGGVHHPHPPENPSMGTWRLLYANNITCSQTRTNKLTHDSFPLSLPLSAFRSWKLPLCFFTSLYLFPSVFICSLLFFSIPTATTQVSDKISSFDQNLFFDQNFLQKRAYIHLSNPQFLTRDLSLCIFERRLQCWSLSDQISHRNPLFGNTHPCPSIAMLRLE